MFTGTNRGVLTQLYWHTILHSALLNLLSQVLLERAETRHPDLLAFYQLGGSDVESGLKRFYLSFCVLGSTNIFLTGMQLYWCKFVEESGVPSAVVSSSIFLNDCRFLANFHSDCDYWAVS